MSRTPYYIVRWQKADKDFSTKVRDQKEAEQLATAMAKMGWNVTITEVADNQE